MIARAGSGPAGRRLPLAGGLLLGLSYLPGPLLALNLTAFVPLLWWLETNRDATSYRRLRAGLVFGATAHLVALHFMYSMLEHSWLAALLYVGMTAALAARIALEVALLGWLRRRTGISWALLLPVVWVAFEWLQSRAGDLRLTGEHLAHTVAGHPFLVQFADVTGPYGVTAALLAFQGLLLETIRGWGAARGRRALAALLLLSAVLLAYDAWAWTRPEPGGDSLRVGLVQPNVPLAVKHDRETRGEQWRKLVVLSRRAAERGAELVVWPESARPGALHHDLARPETYALPEVAALARDLGVPILAGVEYARSRQDGDHDWYNAALAVDAAGQLLPAWGAKVYLVPFVEATPFRGLFGPLVAGRGGEWHWLAGTFRPGPASALLPVAGTRVGVLVCYEQLFPDLARDLRLRGAEVGVVITNDAWFGRSLFQPYQANALRLRAIENRIDFVRVANTGISGFVDRFGRYHQRTGLFEEAVEVREVRLATRPTVYGLVGDAAAWLALGGLALAVLLALGRGNTREPRASAC